MSLLSCINSDKFSGKRLTTHLVSVMSLNDCVHFITSCILGNDTDYFCLVEFVNRLACAGPVSVKLPTLQISHKTHEF